MIVVDDHHLFAVLAGIATRDPPVAAGHEQLFTTASWYYRLARAAHDRTFMGALSRLIEGLDPGRRDEVLEQLDELPPSSDGRRWGLTCSGSTPSGMRARRVRDDDRHHVLTVVEAVERRCSTALIDVPVRVGASWLIHGALAPTIALGSK